MSTGRSLAGAVAALAAALALSAAAPAMGAGPSVGAPAYIVIQPDTGDVVAARNPYGRREMASTTKMMTALLTIEHASPRDVFTVAPYAAGPLESLAGLRAGQRMRVRDLLHALMLASANDAAHTLAIGVAGSQARFVQMMNRRARQLGLRQTHYQNPIGLDDLANHSSARDLARLATVLRRQPFLRRTMDLKRAVLRSGPVGRVVVNRNQLVQNVWWVNGVKTGHTSTAGYVLVGSGTLHGVNAISAVLGTPSEDARNADSLALLRYALARYRRVLAVRGGATYARVPLAHRDTTVALVARHDAHVVARRGERLRRTVTGVPEELDGPLPRGSRQGTVVVRRRGRVVARVPLVTAAAVPQATIVEQVDDVVPGGMVGVGLLLGGLAGATLLVLAQRRRAGRQRSARPSPGSSEAA